MRCIFRKSKMLAKCAVLQTAENEYDAEARRLKNHQPIWQSKPKSTNQNQTKPTIRKSVHNMKRILIPLILAGGIATLPAGSKAQTSETTATTTTHYESCSKLHSMRIRTSDGEVVPVEDVLIDPSEGRIVTVVTTVHEKLVPVPWNVVHVRESESIATVDITREQLYSAPTIERTQITTFDPAVLQRSETFFRNPTSAPAPGRAGMNVDRTTERAPAPESAAGAPAAGASPVASGTNSRTTEKARRRGAASPSPAMSGTSGKAGATENASPAAGESPTHHRSKVGVTPSSGSSESEKASSPSASSTREGESAAAQHHENSSKTESSKETGTEKTAGSAGAEGSHSTKTSARKTGSTSEKGATGSGAGESGSEKSSSGNSDRDTGTKEQSQ